MRNVAFIIIALLFIITCIINGVDSIGKVIINLLIAVGVVAFVGALMGSKD